MQSDGKKLEEVNIGSSIIVTHMEINISPKIELQLFILRAIQLLNRFYAWEQNTQGLKEKIKTEIELESSLWGGIVDLFVEDLGPRAKNITKTIRVAQELQKLQNEETSIKITYRELRKEVEDFLLRVSIKRKNLGFPGNSELLIKRFGRSNDYFKLETKIRHTLVFLKKIAREDLVFNRNLPLEKPKRLKEILMESGKPFSSQKALKEVFASANRYIKIVDPWVSARSLDSLFEIGKEVKIQFLCSYTGGREKERRLIRCAKNLRVEMPNFNIRKIGGEEMHDRWIITEDGIWSLSQSIKDFGRGKTIAFIAPHSNQTKKKVESFFDSLWKKAISIIG